MPTPSTISRLSLNWAAVDWVIAQVCNLEVQFITWEKGLHRPNQGQMSFKSKKMANFIYMGQTHAKAMTQK